MTFWKEIPWQEIQRKLKNFDSKNDVPDDFLLDIYKKEEISDILQDFFKVIFDMFHGNSAVERSFSYNKEFLYHKKPATKND